MRFGFFLKKSLYAVGFLPILLWQYIRCLYHISKLKTPIIAVFGGKRAQDNGSYYQDAFEFASLCSKEGFSILTGGGPGTMVAANCGAISGQPSCLKDSLTLGIGVTRVDEAFSNPCARVIPVHYFFIRKLFLGQFSSMQVFFPGGIGTADEFFDLLNQSKHGIVPPKRIILVNKAYWKPLLDWYCTQGIASGMITFKLEDALYLCDSAQEAFEITKKQLH